MLALCSEVLGEAPPSPPYHGCAGISGSVIPGVTVVTTAGLITDAESRGLTPALAKALKGK